MAYQKTQWKDHIEGVQVGTPVNAVNMNKIEEGIAAAQSADILWTGELTSASTAPSTVTLTNGINQYRMVAVITALRTSTSSYRLMNLFDCMTMGQASQRIRYNDASAVVTSTMRWRSGGDYTKVQFDAVPAGWVITHVVGYR